MNDKTTGYIVSAVIFTLLFCALGYIGFAASTGASGGWGVVGWMTRPIKNGILIWIAAGVVFGIGARYLMTHR